MTEVSIVLPTDALEKRSQKRCQLHKRKTNLAQSCSLRTPTHPLHSLLLYSLALRIDLLTYVVVSITLHVLSEIKRHKVHHFKFDATRRQSLHVGDDSAPPVSALPLNSSLREVAFQFLLDFVLLESCSALLKGVLGRFTLLLERREESLSEEITSTVRSTLECCSLVQVKEEEGQLWHALLLQLWLVTLLDLFKIEDGLPFGVGLVGTPQHRAHVTFVTG